MLTLAFNVQPASSEWTGTVYIRADGSIDPPDAPITTYDNVTYTLTDNITSSGDGIIVERDNIVVDGAGYTIQGTYDYPYKGVDMTGRSNVTIKNMEINTFWIGIRLYDSSNNTIVGNNITNNWYGILLYDSSNNSISGNNITNNRYGIRLYDSSNNSISGNNITANSWIGIVLDSSSNNSISGNNITNNGYGIRLDYSSNNTIVGNIFVDDGLTVFGSYGNVVVDNVVNGKPFVYLEEASGLVVGDAGQVVLVRCSNITVENLNLSNTDVGIQLLETHNTKIANNNITNNGYGIRLDYSSNNTIVGNNITNNGYGILLYDSSNNSISGNNITNNRYGIRLDYSSNNSISGNNITANSWIGIVLDSSSNNSISGNNITNNGYGILLQYSSNNTVSGNNIANNGAGIWLCSSSNNNAISGNKIANNDYGIYLGSSSNNRVYHNNFVDNVQQVYSYNSTNVWDDGYPSGGNYWSDYAGVDADGDGIGDTPYVINGTNQDRYPLMNPWGSGTPIASFNWSPSIPEVNEPVTFDASASIPIGGEIVSYEWDFGDGNQASGKIVTHQYTSAGNFTVTLNVTDSEGLWSIEQKQIKVKAPPPPLTVSIFPTSASIFVGQSVTFTPIVSGGYTPYTYQWYLNSNPVSGATSEAWTFTPTTSGIYYVYLKVTDDKGNTAQSETAHITVSAVPVGGYSYPINKYTLSTPIATHIALTAILTAIFTTIKRKTKRKH